MGKVLTAKLDTVKKLITLIGSKKEVFESFFPFPKQSTRNALAFTFCSFKNFLLLTHPRFQCRLKNHERSQQKRGLVTKEIEVGRGKAFGPPSSAAKRTIKILVGYKVVKSKSTWWYKE